MATDYENEDDEYDDIDDDVYRSSNESSEPDLYCRKPSDDVDKYRADDKHWESEPGSDDEYAGNFRSDQCPPEDGNSIAAAGEERHGSGNDVRTVEMLSKSIERRDSTLNATAMRDDGLPSSNTAHQSAVETAVMSLLQNKMAASDLSRIMAFDNNVSPTSKITMLESAIYGLHRQQLMQLELIETLRRQLAAAVAAQADSVGTPPPKHTPFSCHDLIIPRSGQSHQRAPVSDTTSPEVDGTGASETSTAFVGGGNSSLSNLMRLSASVDRQVHQNHHHHHHQHSQQAPTSSSPGQQTYTAESDPKWSSQSVNRGEADLPTTTGMRRDDLDQSKSRDLGTKTAAPHSGGLGDLGLFKKGESFVSLLGRITQSNRTSKSDEYNCTVQSKLVASKDIS